MKANISEAKNNFSSLIEKVKKGKSVVIFDREQPVAQIVPIFFSEDKDLVTLISSRGNIRAPLESLATDFYNHLTLASPDEGDILEALLKDREESRN